MDARTIIIPAALVIAARNLGACLVPAAAGMFITPMSASGANPPTYYVSSGTFTDAGFTTLLSDATLMYSMAQQGAAAQGLTLTATQADCNNLVAQSVVVDLAVEQPFDTFARLGLKIINPPI